MRQLFKIFLISLILSFPLFSQIQPFSFINKKTISPTSPFYLVFSPAEFQLGTHKVKESVFLTFYPELFDIGSYFFKEDNNTPQLPIKGTYFVDYLNGDDNNIGNLQYPFKHSPNDPLAAGISNNTILVANDTIVFKGGVEYLGQILSNENNITYLGTSGWGNGPAVINMQNTRGYAFKGTGDNIKIQGFDIFNYPTGTDYPIYPSTGATSWTIDDCTIAFVTGWNSAAIFPDHGAIMFTNTTSGHKVTNSEFFANGRNSIKIRYASDIDIRQNDFGGINRGDSTGWISVGIRMEVTARRINIVKNSFHDCWQYGGDQDPELNHAPAYIRTGSITTGGDIGIDSNLFYNNRIFNTGTGTGHIEIAGGNNIRIRHNTSVNSIQFWGANILLAISDSVWVENNTFIDRDYLSASAASWNITIYSGPTSTTGDNIWIRNNIFWNDDDRSASANIRLMGTQDTYKGIVDYNAYFRIPESNIWSSDDGNGDLLSWNSLGHDVNSMFYEINEYGSEPWTYFINIPQSQLLSGSGNYGLSQTSPQYLKNGGYLGNHIGSQYDPYSVVFNKFVTPLGSGNHDGSSLSNAWTIREAAANVSPGDIVFVQKGQYDITGTAPYQNITLSQSGTSVNPIIFVGEYVDNYNPETVDGDSIAWFYCNSATNGQINIDGNYIEWRNIATYQVTGRQTYNISGDNVVIDSCVIITDPAVVSEHTLVMKPSSQNGILSNSYLLRSGRCHIYVEADNTSAANNWTMDANIFKGASEHNSIEYMPLTDASSSQFIYNAVIKNNTFIDNPYPNNILLRHNMNAKIYNNVFINSGYIKFEPHNYGVQTTDTVLVAYNTFVENTDGYVLDNQAMRNVTWVNNLYYYTGGLSTLYLYRIGDVFTGNNIDYNLYYDGDATFNPAITYSSSANYSTTWKSTFGFDTHSIAGVTPTFINAALNNFKALNENSPQVGVGTPVTTTNGYIINIAVDKDGLPRDPLNPTIGANEFIQN